MEISNLSDSEVKILVIRMLKELSEDLNSIKKIQSGHMDKTKGEDGSKGRRWVWLGWRRLVGGKCRQL